jgi:PTH1 family peptidyl-tRNA hydrolase
MRIIAGLGNPGDKYQFSRHNIGFMLVDKYALSRKLNFVKDGNSLYAGRNTFKLIKPQTYMNLSGVAIARYVESSEELLVVCDDIYLPFGEIRLRQSGGDGGHNGLNSIISELRSDSFNRMRIGVGLPEHSHTLSHYVLDDFSLEEFHTLEKTAEFAIKLIDCFIANGFQSMINHFSKNKKSYSESIISESKSKGGE